MKRLLLTLAAVVGVASMGSAQITLGGGALTGSVESNSIYYLDDAKIGKELDATFGSNNHIKLD